ncbi:Oligosaccharyltransferase 48 kDa subunit beta-domain-containing protein [Blastocladiella britannica]|nr:Oligosaccharyltransferase 48 kDa subunit beta-domain-containing protein [Blastocladiella britannica]
MTNRPRATTTTLVLATTVMLAAIVLPAAHAASLTGQRVLAVVDEPATAQATYSQLLQMLTDRGFTVDVQASGPTVRLVEHGDRTSDHLLLLAPSKPLKDALAPAAVIDYLRTGGNLVLAMAAGVTDSYKDVAYELGLDVSRPASSFAPGKSAVVVTDVTALVPAATARAAAASSDSASALAYPQGLGLTVHAATNPGIEPVLSIGGSAGTPAEVLVAAVQATNGARALVLGSAGMLANAAFSPNRAIVDQLLQWTMHEKSVVRVVSASHAKFGGSKQLDMYRIRDTITYNITLQQWTVDRWRPYLVAAGDQLQWSATMLDPYLRLPMSLAFTTATAATYTVTAQLPDVYGVFTLAVQHARAGWTWIDHAETISIRPFRHNEYPRWLTVAWPYYAAVVMQSVAALVVAALWVTYRHVPAPGGTGEEKKKDAPVVADPVARANAAAAALIKAEQHEAATTSASSRTSGRGAAEPSPVGGRARKRKN